MKFNIQLFAVPFHRVSKSRKRLRRSHNALTAVGTVKCPNCGFYKGKEEIKMTKEEAK